ncbi:MAG: SIS domain-containing protein [Spirochaetia bacterium]|nr:SIS domain-containing protein [Spirochaetia bacterium]
MKYIDQLIERYPSLCVCKADIESAVKVLINSFKNGGKLLIAGNGGSCADSDHITGELLKSFYKKRCISNSFIAQVKSVDEEIGSYLVDKIHGALPAIALSNNTALMTAGLNDVDGNIIFAQQVNGYGVKGDVFLGISTSGNSENIVYATVIAKAKGLMTLALSGKGGGKLKHLADISIVVPQTETYMIQELHLPIYHAVCLEVEEYFWIE